MERRSPSSPIVEPITPGRRIGLGDPAITYPASCQPPMLRRAARRRLLKKTRHRREPIRHLKTRPAADRMASPFSGASFGPAVKLIFRYPRNLQKGGCAPRPRRPSCTHGRTNLVWKSDGRQPRRAEYRDARRDCAVAGSELTSHRWRLTLFGIACGIRTEMKLLRPTK